jgi:hypothetical protein
MKSIALGLLLPLTIVGFASAESTSWVKNPAPTDAAPCLRICQDHGGKNSVAVRAGIYGKEPYYVCAADMEGMRPGYQVLNHPAGPVCNVGHDSKEKASPVAQCLCASDSIFTQ